MTPAETSKMLKSLGCVSTFDPSRANVGKIYRDTQLNYKGGSVTIGDMANEITKGLIEDINDGLNTPLESDAPFYLIVTEKRDLQMKNAIARSRIIKPYRPWPEDNTMVFWKDPKSQEVRFCWDLPHYSEMPNVIENAWQYHKDYVAAIQAWKRFDMRYFGFYYHKKFKWIPMPNYTGDKPIEQFKKTNQAAQEVFKMI